VIMYAMQSGYDVVGLTHVHVLRLKAKDSHRKPFFATPQRPSSRTGWTPPLNRNTHIGVIARTYIPGVSPRKCMYTAWICFRKLTLLTPRAAEFR